MKINKEKGTSLGSVGSLGFLRHVPPRQPRTRSRRALDAASSSFVLRQALLQGRRRTPRRPHTHAVSPTQKARTTNSLEPPRTTTSLNTTTLGACPLAHLLSCEAPPPFSAPFSAPPPFEQVLEGARRGAEPRTGRKKEAEPGIKKMGVCGNEKVRGWGGCSWIRRRQSLLRY